jgi:hypothetical protein
MSPVDALTYQMAVGAAETVGVLIAKIPKKPLMTAVASPKLNIIKCDLCIVYPLMIGEICFWMD